MAGAELATPSSYLSLGSVAEAKESEKGFEVEVPQASQVGFVEKNRRGRRGECGGKEGVGWIRR